ncbi:MAG: hypothetical protein WA728_04305 [Xanthobacteraceae bacterium]
MSKSFKGYFAFGLYIAVLLALYMFRVRPSSWWLASTDQGGGKAAF